LRCAGLRRGAKWKGMERMERGRVQGEMPVKEGTSLPRTRSGKPQACPLASYVYSEQQKGADVHLRAFPGVQNQPIELCASTRNRSLTPGYRLVRLQRTSSSPRRNRYRIALALRQSPHSCAPVSSGG
jgi:hypothetical protein